MSATRTIYRVERDDGEGPFVGGLGSYVDGYTSWEGRGPPVAYPEFIDALRVMDLEPDEGHPARFGCPDLDAARWWFWPEAIAFLRREGKPDGRTWYLVAYEVPVGTTVVHGPSRQVVFDSRRAKPLARMALDRLHADRAQWELPL